MGVCVCVYVSTYLDSWAEWLLVCSCPLVSLVGGACQVVLLQQQVEVLQAVHLKKKTITEKDSPVNHLSQPLICQTHTQPHSLVFLSFLKKNNMVNIVKICI